MDIAHLNTKAPLGDKIDRIGEFVNVRRFESLMVCGHADVPLEIILEWSPDGLEKTMESVLNVPSDQWKSLEFPVLMSFVRLHLINKCSSRSRPNKDLAVVVTPRGGAAYIMADSPSVEQQEKRSRSPIRRFMDNIPTGKQSSKRSSSYGSPSVGRDDRVPDYIPENVILIGGKSGRVQLLPRGNPGEVLTVSSDGKLVWATIASLINPPERQSSRSSLASDSSGKRTPPEEMKRSTSRGIKLSFSSIPQPSHEPPELPAFPPSYSIDELPPRLSIASVDSA